MACQGLCTTKGLTVLPVRYAVVPENINASLPGWANDPCITGVTLASNEKYTLRALRQGYLTFFMKKESRAPITGSATALRRTAHCGCNRWRLILYRWIKRCAKRASISLKTSSS